MTLFQCQTCGATKQTRLDPPPYSMPCEAATGSAGGRCGGRMVQPFTLSCIRCDYTRQATSTPSDPSFEIPCPRCGARLA